MNRLPYLALALVLAACGVDNRAKTVEYVTESILAPTCGAAQCHSTFAGNIGDIFDTVKGARASLVNTGLISFDSAQYDPANPANANLIIWITQTDPFSLGVGRMPYDAPMPAEDVRFLEEWIAAGATGAQCDPANELSCNGTLVVKCQADWNFGPVVDDCAAHSPAQGCTAGACK